MSLCIGWIRKTKVSEEVVLVSDSCFSGGHRFVAAPKLFAMSRGDFALACAGSTTYSFSMNEQYEHGPEMIPELNVKDKR